MRWFEAQGLIKTHVDPAEVIDTQFLGALPAK